MKVRAQMKTFLAKNYKCTGEYRTNAELRQEMAQAGDISPDKLEGEAASRRLKEVLTQCPYAYTAERQGFVWFFPKDGENDPKAVAKNKEATEARKKRRTTPSAPMMPVPMSVPTPLSDNNTPPSSDALSAGEESVEPDVWILLLAS